MAFGGLFGRFFVFALGGRRLHRHRREKGFFQFFDLAAHLVIGHFQFHNPRREIHLFHELGWRRNFGFYD